MLSYPIILRDISVGGYPSFIYAQWLHPHEREKTFDKCTFDMYAKWIPKRGAILDIGAHTGDTSVMFAVISGQGGVVYSVEPNPVTFRILQINACLNDKIAKIIPQNCAVMPEDKQYGFQYTDEGQCNGGYAEILSDNAIRSYLGTTRVMVTGSQMGFLKGSKFDFIKIDTEGSDLQVLKTLPVLAPIIQVEFFPGLSFEDKMRLFGYLDMEIGYQVCELTTQTPVTEEYVMKTYHCWDAICFKK